MFEGHAEYQLIARGMRRGGWTAERPQLPVQTETGAVEIVAHLLLPGKETEFRKYLRLIFSEMVEAEHHRQSYRSAHLKHLDQEDMKGGLGAGSVAKYGTMTQTSLHGLAHEYRQLHHHRRISHKWMARFFRKVRQNSAVFGLICAVAKLEQKRGIRLHFVSRYRRDAFYRLGVAFETASRTLATTAKPGRSDPVYEQMARVLAALYLHCTGHLPRRSYDAKTEKDGGPFLRLCRIMAQAINDAQPDTIKRRPAPQMAKTARRMMDELKAEQSVESARHAG
jgi:hypothetical protein